MNKYNLCGMTVEDIADLISPGGFNYSQAVIVAGTIYRKGIAGLEKTTRIPKKLKKYLSDIAGTGIYDPVRSEKSVDGTVKFLFESPGGMKFESVYIPESKRKTICVSTQSGCRMGCPFCVTGRYGFHGNLSSGDILNQLISIPFRDEITHVVFMGMGEPLDNPENVLKAIRILTAQWGMSISQRNITVSTVGITQMIMKFLKESDCNFTLSLFSPFPEERKSMIPAERIYPVKEIIGIMESYPLRKKRRLSIAYVMINGLNDTNRHLDGMIRLLRDTRIRVNLLPFHPVDGDDLRSSPDDRIQFFKHQLVIAGISASVRRSRGEDISAACGLLASGLK